MKRDMDLARMILIRIEEQAMWSDPINTEFEGYSLEMVSYHIMLLYDAGLIKAIDMSGGNEICWFPQSLTWEGHEFLEASRDEKRWKQAKNIMAEAGGFVLEVAKPLLIDLMKAQVMGKLA